MKTDLIVSMHRTGHHAVAVWLLHQREGITDFSISTITRWLFVVGDDSNLYMMANNPLKTGPNEHSDKEKLPSIISEVKPSGLIITHEQDKINDTLFKAYKSPFSFNEPIVVVIRDFRNWVASCIKMAERDNPIDSIGYMSDYIDDEKVSVYKDHLLNYDKPDCYYIIFNDWATSRLYRKAICNDLGYTFTDAAKDQLSIFGGGSSFTGMDYLKSASQMDVNNRYKEMETHPYYKMVINKYEEALNLSDNIFK
tara:strand:+ start:3115 stop:3873 length:759 start_codon:yes stop_codon:yes gene_type:complete